MMVHGVGWTSPRESGQEVSLMVLYTECRLYLLVLNVETAYNVCITNCITCASSLLFVHHVSLRFVW